MTNTEIIQAIKAEIERRIKSIDSCPFIEAEFGAEVRREGKLQGYKELLSFLDTLQEPEVKEQKSQDTVGRVSIEIRSNLQTDEVVRKTLIMLVNDGRISVTGAITSSDILDWLEGQKVPEVDLEKELDAWRHNHFKGKRDGHYSGEYLERTSQLDLARYFFELRKNAK